MNFKTLISTTLAVTTVLSGGEALASQERYNPNTFARELNSLNWTAGYDVEFSHLRSCSQYNSNTYVHVNGQEWIDNLERQRDEALQANIDANKYKDDQMVYGYDAMMAAQPEVARTWRIYQALDERFEAEKNNTRLVSSTPTSYSCYGGFVKVTSPKGTKVCDVTYVNLNYNSYKASYNSKGCVWKY